MKKPLVNAKDWVAFGWLIRDMDRLQEKADFISMLKKKKQFDKQLANALKGYADIAKRCRDLQKEYGKKFNKLPDADWYVEHARIYGLLKKYRK